MIKKHKLIILPLIVLMAGVLFTVTAWAQQDNNNQGRRGQGRGDWSPERMQEMMLDRTTSGLKMNAQEAKVIVPKIKAIQDYRFNSGRELQPLRQDLNDLLQSENPNKAMIKQKLDSIKTKTADIRKKTESMENELRAVLSLEQEAQLTVRGVLGGGPGFGGFGFGGGRGGSGGGRDRGDRGNRDNN